MILFAVPMLLLSNGSLVEKVASLVPDSPSPKASPYVMEAVHAWLWGGGGGGGGGITFEAKLRSYETPPSLSIGMI